MNVTIGISEMITAATALIVVVSWLIRLEGRVTYGEKLSHANEKSLDELRAKHEALDSKIVEKLSNVERSLAKIEGRLSIDNDKSH